MSTGIAVTIITIAVTLGILAKIADWMNLLPLSEGKGEGDLSWYRVVDYARSAVAAAEKATGSADHNDLGDKAAEYLQTKYPKLKDVDIRVAIGSALRDLDELARLRKP